MAYEYDHDCPFEAFITNLGKYNEGELVGEWVKFPTTSEELQKVFERIGIGSKDDFGNPYEEWFISDYDCYVDGLYEKLGEYENLDELNYLASKLDELDDHDYNHFQAAMQISDYTGSIKDVINLIDNLDKYEIYPGVESNADLGHYYIEELGMMEVPDYLAEYIDYEAYGRDVAINEMGQFTDYGYVRDTQESFTEYYDGDRENIPDEYRVMDFMVSGEKERKTMNYETFKQEFAEDIKEKLYERGYDDVRISFHNVEKTNQNYEANGPWMIPDFKSEDKAPEGFYDKVGIMLLPGNGMESVPTPGDMVGAKDPEKIKAAVAFLKFETTAENQLKALEMAGLQPVSSDIEVPESLKESDPLMAEVLDIQSKATYTYGQNQAYWYQNVIDEFSNQLPELASGSLDAEGFCKKLTDAAQKND